MNHAQIKTVTNFRSVGGMAATGGTVRHGVVYRSGDLADLSAQDAGLLQDLGIQLICDLRSDRERLTRGSVIPSTWKVECRTYDLASPTSNTLLDLIKNAALRPEHVVHYLQQRNNDFATLLAPRFGQLLSDIAELPENAAVLIHCAAGKDRTGFAVALIQFALGVGEPDVMEEYLATRKYLNADLLSQREIEAFKRAGFGEIDPACYQPMTQVRPEYIEFALSHIREAGVTSFLRHKAEVPAAVVDRLREKLVQSSSRPLNFD